jgi:hypothetical protein
MKNKMKILNEFFKFHLIFKKKPIVSYYFKKTNGLHKNRNDLSKNEKSFKKLRARNFGLIKQKFNLKIEQERKNFKFHQNLIIGKSIRNFVYKTILLKFNQFNFFFLRSEVFNFIKRNFLISTFNFNCKFLKQRFLTEFFKNTINFLGKYFREKKILFKIIKCSLKNSKKIRIQKNKFLDKKFLFSKKSSLFEIIKIKIIDMKDQFSMFGLYFNFHNSTLNIWRTLKNNTKFQTPINFFRVDFFEKEANFMNRYIILNFLTINFPKFRYFFFQKVIFQNN